MINIDYAFYVLLIIVKSYRYNYEANIYITMKDGFKKGGSACLLLLVLLVPCVLITVYEKIYL